MKTLHTYLTRQVLAAVLMTVTVFTFVLLLGNVLKEIIELLINRQATLWLVVQAIGLLIPYVLVFALPMGMLTATLLVFGRFSADNELTAVRASGISLIALITPVLIVSALLSGLCAWVNLEIAPKSRNAYKALIYNAVRENPAGLLRENQYNVFSEGWTVYVRKIKGNDLQGVKLYQVDEEQNSITWINARAGKFALEEGQLILFLYDAIPSQVQDGDVTSGGFWSEQRLELEPKTAKERKKEPALADMTLGELRSHLNKLERTFIPIKAKADGAPKKLREEMQKMKRLREEITTPVRVQIHRQVSFSFACIGFTLVGIPLGIRAHRRETSVGMGIALLLVLVYYSFIILAQSWDERPEFYPHLILWIPNFFFQIVGGFLLWRANKGVS